MYAEAMRNKGSAEMGGLAKVESSQTGAIRSNGALMGGAPIPNLTHTQYKEGMSRNHTKNAGAAGDPTTMERGVSRGYKKQGGVEGGGPTSASLYAEAM